MSVRPDMVGQLCKDLKQNAYSKSVGFIIKLGKLLSSGDEC